MSRTALITGVTGQDGCLLAALLLDKGYSVVGSSRDWALADLGGLQALELEERLTFATLDCGSVDAWRTLLEDQQPDEIYHFSAASSVGASFAEPWTSLVEGCRIAAAPLEALRLSGGQSRLFAAGSTECFGDGGGKPIDENTPLAPKSPYGVAKAQAWMAVKTYRESYGLWSCTGIFSNHESPLRKAKFVTGKIVAAIQKIKRGESNELRLGNLDVWRDWGWADEYVEAAWRMLQAEEARDYVIASGASISLQDFATAAFEAGGLDLEAYLVQDTGLYRQSEIKKVECKPERVAHELGWRAETIGLDVARRLVTNSS
jgi:GDPmannose 4,6-dehydratase